DQKRNTDTVKQCGAKGIEHPKISPGARYAGEIRKERPCGMHKSAMGFCRNSRCGGLRAKNRLCGYRRHAMEDCLRVSHWQGREASRTGDGVSRETAYFAAKSLHQP